MWAATSCCATKYQVPGLQSVETGKQICAHLSLAQKLRTHKKIKGKRKNEYQIPPLVSEINEPKAVTTRVFFPTGTGPETFPDWFRFRLVSNQSKFKIQN